MRTPPDQRELLSSMRTAVIKARAGVNGLTLSRYQAEIYLPLACQKLIENIGEAANKLTEATRDLMPDIEWRKIIGLRHRLVHEYDDIDDTLIWLIIHRNLPDLEQALTRTLTLPDL